MNKLKIIAAVCIFIISQTGYSQKWGIDPYLSFLKGERDINIEFSYDSLTVTSGFAGQMFGTNIGNNLETSFEPVFVKDKKDKFNQQSPGSGDKWTEEWYKARQMYFEPKFEEEFKNRLQKIGINADRKNRGAKYTLIIKTTNIMFARVQMPNYATGNTKGKKVGTFCDYYVTFVETKDHSKILARSIGKLVYGKHISVFNLGSFKAALVAACYERAGRYFGKGIIKALSK